MQVQFLNSPDFTIDENGQLERSGCWLLSSADTGEEITALAEQWAGAINDFWRQPDAAGKAYTLDSRLRVKSINCKALDKCHCHVKFTAAAAASAPGSGNDGAEVIAGSFRFERNCDLTEYQTISYKLSANDLALLPQVGDAISWAGNDYRCESVTCKESADKTFVAEVRAVNTAVTPAGSIQSEQLNDEEYKIGSWLIMPEKLESFLQENRLHSTADWAGKNFYIYKITTAPANSAQRTKVTLTARRSQLEMIEALRSEEIVSMVFNTPDKAMVWHSRWRATAADRDIFAGKLGSSAMEWTGDSDAIVCKVTPKRISDCEFEYLLEARRSEDIDRQHNFDRKDLDLPNRLEYYTRIGEMRLSPGQCGYTWRHNGTYRLINNWLNAQLCPLDTATALSQRWINQPIKVLEVMEVSFLAGTSVNHLNQISSWFTGQRVANTTIAGISGCFLRYDLDIDDICDSYGRDWTRIVRVYRKSPGSYNWNPNYWV